MRIVNRLRVFGFLLTAASHLALLAVLSASQLDWIVVSMGIGGFMTFALAPLLAGPLFTTPLAHVDAFVERVKGGRFDACLPVRHDHGQEADACELNRLRQSLNWMARQIELREARIREQCEQALSMQRELREMVIRDPLTRIHNRLFFQDQLVAACDEFARRGRSFTIAIADVDFFKNINDNYGHQAGDRILVMLAEALRRSLRECDVVARIGGEEFGILLRGVGAKQAENLLGRLLASVRGTPFPLEGDTILRVTVSMGYVSAEQPTVRTHDDLVRRADEALYHVKRNGRDGMIGWQRIGCRGGGGRAI